MDIFSDVFVVKIVMFAWKEDNKQTRPGMAHLFKKTL